jgi:glycine betaine/proline transport system ATP-binding protein
VPREKVLKIESVMDPLNSSDELSDLRVSKDAIIETVVVEVLSAKKPVAVVDNNDKIVGVLHYSKVIHTLFGENAKK